jgi:hypothetical protein
MGIGLWLAAMSTSAALGEASEDGTSMPIKRWITAARIDM